MANRVAAFGSSVPGVGTQAPSHPRAATYLVERAAHARSIAVAKGRQVGRPVTVTPAQLAYATQLRDAGETIAQIVAKTGVTRSSLYRHLPPRPPEPLTVAGPPPTDRPEHKDEIEIGVGDSVGVRQVAVAGG